jgi:hypothetical protein
VAAPAAAPVGADIVELKRRAEDAYTGINDALSELRVSVLLAKELVMTGAPKNELTDAIDSSMERAEDAKGTLRSLRELVEA